MVFLWNGCMEKSNSNILFTPISVTPTLTLPSAEFDLIPTGRFQTHSTTQMTKQRSNIASPSTRNPWRSGKWVFFKKNNSYTVHWIYGSFSVSHPTKNTLPFFWKLPCCKAFFLQLLSLIYLKLMPSSVEADSSTRHWRLYFNLIQIKCHVDETWILILKTWNDLGMNSRASNAYKLQLRYLSPLYVLVFCLSIPIHHCMLWKRLQGFCSTRFMQEFYTKICYPVHLRIPENRYTDLLRLFGPLDLKQMAEIQIPPGVLDPTLRF